LIRHRPVSLREGKPVPPFRFRDFGAWSRSANSFGTLAALGYTRAGSSKAARD
jgi:hypothetical protein